MFTTRPLTLAASLAAVLLLSGCFGSENSPTGDSVDTLAEEEAIQTIIFDEEADFADPDVRYFQDNDGPALAPINTHFWRRELLALDKLTEITIENPAGEPATAEVEVTADAMGTLHLFACADSALDHLTKDFQDTGMRSLFFQRVRDRSERHRGWKLVALSGVEIESPGTTRAINSVRVEADGVDETITGVSELIRLEDVLRLPAESDVTLTVDTGDASDQVFLHLRHSRRRLELESNGDGTFTGVYRTSSRPGPRHAVVDVLSEDTLFDDVAPYDNVAWGYPYVIEGPDADATGDAQ